VCKEFCSCLSKLRRATEDGYAPIGLPTASIVIVKVNPGARFHRPEFNGTKHRPEFNGIKVRVHHEGPMSQEAVKQLYNRARGHSTPIMWVHSPAHMDSLSLLDVGTAFGDYRIR
jgi:hypothetical protein